MSDVKVPEEAVIAAWRVLSDIADPGEGLYPAHLVVEAALPAIRDSLLAELESDEVVREAAEHMYGCSGPSASLAMQGAREALQAAIAKVREGG